MNPADPLETPRSRDAGSTLLDGLNDEQREAVTHRSGPLLVLAGAGSGKTRVITHRIVHLIVNERVPPSHITAVTFTNKAAAEMRGRVEALLGPRKLGSWIGTFHALCLRILRYDGPRIGLASGFNIYDTDDQLAVVKRLLKDEAGEENLGTPRTFLSRISRAKNALRPPEDLEQQAFTPDQRLTAVIYSRYEEALRKANAVDFDDLLLRTIQLFHEHSDVAAAYAERCEHLLVDEYQDTNRPQYLLVRALSARHGNICVVGDEDQCIYRFRGAELRNILEFESDHPGARTIRLEQNYRSTGNILDAAGAVVARNLRRKGKRLWTENERGEPLDLFRAPDDRTEAIWIAGQVKQFSSTFEYEDMAVLYRTNAQSRLLEEIFRREQIEYQIVGSVQFYARKEIKDLLAYLKLASNPADDVAFRRIVNTPTRGIGDTTMRSVSDVARGMGLPLMEAAGHALNQGLLSSRSARQLDRFLDFLSQLGSRADDEPVAELMQAVVEETAYEAYLDKAYPGLGAERMENVQALISAAAEYAEETEDPTLEGFLDRSALVSDADNVGRRPGVTLMTVHCAKGLEFPLVFLVGLEEKLFPHMMASDTDDDIEEERRLCYVAMTRARQRLLLAHARFRRFQGAFMPTLPSRFLQEIPAELIREISPADAGFEDWGVRAPADGYASGGSSAARASRHRPVPAAPVPSVTHRAFDDGFSVGAFVQHPRFGSGQITDREGDGKRLKLTIQFLDHGAKKILPSYTRLKVEI